MLVLHATVYCQCCWRNRLGGRSKLVEAVACDDARDAASCWDSHLGTEAGHFE